MSQLPQDIVQSVAISNLNSIAGQPAMLANLAHSNLVNNTNLAQQNALAHQQAMNQLGMAILAKASNMVAGPGPLQARSASALLSGNETASNVSTTR